MLDPTLTPTRLVDPKTRPRLRIVEPTKPSRFRTFVVLVGVMRVAWTLTLLKLGSGTPELQGVKLRRLFETMGGLWFKVGQLLSLRVDILPIEVCRELARLQFSGLGFPGSHARQILESELGGPIEQWFDEFTTDPFAAASIGQVHRAHLRLEDKWVAVKVQRPYVAELFRRDLVFIQWLTRILRMLHVYPHLRWYEFMWELEHMMNEELDYHYEAASMRRMRKRLRRHGIYVPKVYGDYTTSRVLVSEFIHAVLMADYIRMTESDPTFVRSWEFANNVDPKRIARRLIHSMWRQLFEENLYHSDLHPGNIVLLRDSRVALIDFGATSFTERAYLEKFKMCVAALSNHDYAKAADLTFLLSSALPPIDTEIAKEKLIRMLRAWSARTHVKALPYHERSVDNAAVIVLHVMVEYKCTMDWAWLRIRRALGTLDASLIFLFPDLNYMKITRDYFRRAQARKLRRLAESGLMARAFQSSVSAMEAQDQLAEYAAFQTSIIRRQAQVFQAASSKFSYAVSVMIGWLAWLVLAHAVLLLLALVERASPGRVTGVLGQQMWSVLSGFVPELEVQPTIIAVAVELYLFTRIRSLRAWLRAKDTRPHTLTRAA